MSETEKRVPELRFKGFIDDWEQRKLETLVDKVKSYSLSREVETGEYTGYKYIHYGDIHKKVANVIDESSTLPNIRPGNYDLLDNGDLVLADASEDYQGIAMPAVVTMSPPYNLVAGLHTIALRPIAADPMFLYYLIRSPIFREYGYKIGTGMKVFGISATNVLKFESKFPPVNEQEKIGKLLKVMDDTIDLHQRKLNLLKRLKQTYLNTLFPQNGENSPVLRFAGFSEPWEHRKLEEIANVYDGTHQTPNYTDSGIMFLSVENIKTLNSIKYISEEAFEKDFKIRPQKGDILMTRIGDIGTANVVQDDEPVAYYVSLALLKPIKIESYFLATSIATQFVQDGLWKRTLHIAFPKKINKNEISKVEINVPSSKEQKEIGYFFKQLDDTIDLHQQKITHLQSLKDSFLNKMFI